MAERALAVVILAAGKGTRMRSTLPKVLHRALGQSLLSWVLEACAPLGVDRTVVVVGHEAEQVEAHLAERGDDSIVTVLQKEQNGTGDAAEIALQGLEGFSGDVLIVNGDGALFRTETMRAVLDRHREVSSAATTLAIASDEQLPYGRVLRDVDGSVLRIVEAGDATPEELETRELNAGVYCFDADSLREDVRKVGSDNAKGERYITDLFGIAREAGRMTFAAVAGSTDELLGVNTLADLATTEELLQSRITRSLMESGVRIELPTSIVLEPTVTVEPGATILPGCVLRGTSSIADGATVGPNTTLLDTTVEPGATVTHSHCIEASIGPEATVGPFGYLRPGSRMEKGSKVGAFVELKNTTLHDGAKVPHLSYIGDAEIGAGANIGAGTITANFRPELGPGKQRTVVGAGARTASDNVFVAPVTIGEGAFTGAGSIIVEDVPAGALAIARARQVNLPDYAQRLAAKQQQLAGDTSTR
jgi:bifunctional UDP-N-acetylglucosamine pyrophosphorylase/glucosamine-1-phosphate N-acetyltransferase